MISVKLSLKGLIFYDRDLVMLFKHLLFDQFS